MSDWLSVDLKPFIDKCDDAQIVALVLYGEARSEPVQGIVAVGSVIRNRVRKPGWWGHDFKGVCTHDHQFSCLNPIGGKANYQRVLAFADKLANGTQIIHPRERQCVWIAHGIIGDYVIDPTKASTSYHTAALNPRPQWALGKTPAAQVGGHVFYNNVS